MMRMTFALLAIIFACFILQGISPAFENAFIFNPQDLHAWQFVSAIFLHGGLMHLLLNAYALFAFGLVLENRLGEKMYLALFLATGIFGNILYYLTIVFGIIPPIPALGASGAIFGIFGALVVTDPHLRLLLFGVIPLKISHAAILWFVLESIGSFNVASGIASAAHLGGLVAGYAIAKFFYKPKAQYATYHWRNQ